MKKINLLRELEGYAVFNNKIVREITHKDGSYVKVLVYRLKKEGLIMEIEKNKYTMQKDLLIIASNMVWPCYLSCWTALRYYNLTEQLPQNIFVISPRARKTRKVDFNNNRILFIKIKPNYFFGFKKESYDGFTIFIAEKEKALIDAVLLKKISFSEICSIVKQHVNDINHRLLIDYLKKIKNKSLIKRFGLLLDSCNFDFHNELKKFINAPYIPLDYCVAVKGRKNKKWKIVENVKLPRT